jgi:hypothetical protein
LQNVRPIFFEVVGMREGLDTLKQGNG